MNPNAPQPSFELPAPLPPIGGEKESGKAEQAPKAPEQAPANTQPAAPATQPSLPQSPSPQHPSANTQASQSSSAPLIADDNDLIEKEWVTKAKQIVSATREDPHVQNREISRFKADYLKKRYNKDIKLEDA